MPNYVVMFLQYVQYRQHFEQRESIDRSNGYDRYQSCSSWSAKQGILNFPFSSFAPENYLVLRDRFDRPVPRQPTYLHTQAAYIYMLVPTHGIPPAFRDTASTYYIYICHQPPSGQPRVNRVTIEPISQYPAINGNHILVESKKHSFTIHIKDVYILDTGI